MALFKSNRRTPSNFAGNFDAADVGDNRPAQRQKLFVTSFALSLALGLGYLSTLDSIYESKATLLISPPVAIDQRSDDADTQRLAIQREILLSPDVLARTLKRLEESGATVNTPLDELRARLSVKPVEGTNLIELEANGIDRQFLPAWVKAWVDIYLQARAEDVNANVQRTLQGIDRELEQLAQRIESARQRLKAFREAHDIVSAEREENEALSRLRGLNDSMNKALEEEVKAKSHLDELRSAVKNGTRVVADSQREYVSNLENKLNALRARLAVLERQYTREYINLKPELKQIPEDIRALEEELRNIDSNGANLAVNEAQQVYAQAQSVARNLEKEFAMRKAEARQITATFAEHEALVSDLAELEQLHRDTLTRLAQIETREFERYPQVSVIAGASSAVRIWPDYRKYFLAVLVGSLAIAIFCVWLFSWLRGRNDTGAITLSGIHIYPQSAQDALNYERVIRESLEQRSSKALGSDPENPPEQRK